MITLKEASLSYKRNNPVLDRVDLDIQPGCIYGLLGKNGEGKTTLLNILSGQLFLNKGICRVFGQNPAERNAGLLQKLFLLPEEINMPDVTAMQYVRMYAPFYPTFSDDILKACFESFEVDFSARLNKMSQGQRKGRYHAGVCRPYSTPADGRTDQRTGHPFQRRVPQAVGFIHE